MKKRVYKFTRAVHGVSNLKEKRLKVSTIDELNDPFDLSPLDTTDQAISKAADALTVFFRETAAILLQPELGQPSPMESLRRWS